MTSLMDSVKESLEIFKTWPEWKQRAATEFLTEILVDPKPETYHERDASI